MLYVKVHDKKYFLNTTNYPAGEVNPTLPTAFFKDVEEINKKLSKNPTTLKLNIFWHYKSDVEFLPMAFLVEKLNDLIAKEKFGLNQNNAKVCLHIPYLPFARMDRIRIEEQFLTLKYFIKQLVHLPIETLYLTDVHSQATKDLFAQFKPKFQVIYNSVIPDLLNKTLTEILEKNKYELEDLVSKVVIVYPDETAYKRYNLILKTFEQKISTKLKNESHFKKFITEKKRDFDTGNLIGFNLKEIISENSITSDIQVAEVDLSNFNLKEKYHFILIDDICSRGGTFLANIEEIKKKGFSEKCEYVLVVSHLEHSYLEGKLVKQPNFKVCYGDSLHYAYLANIDLNEKKEEEIQIENELKIEENEMKIIESLKKQL